MTGTDDLLVEIARCRVFRECKSGARPSSDPCARVVAFQADVGLDDHHLPEPWSGRLSEAPILFVSSNPSINRNEQFPVPGWDDDAIVDFFENRFEGGRKRWVVDGARSLRVDGTHSRPVRSWTGVRNRASDLLGRPAMPGRDYAVVDIVRCKSPDEVGVAAARLTCATRYLRRTIEASAATVIVTLGEKARPTVASLFGGPPRMGVHGPVEIGGRTRYLASLGHPTSGEPKRWENCVGEEWLVRLRESIREQRSGRG